jgi:predicted esterase
MMIYKNLFRFIPMLLLGVLFMANTPLFAELSFGSMVTMVGVETKPGAKVYDISWPASREVWKTTTAFAVIPDNSPAGPGIVYFHQLGMQRDRKQFLGEALLLAKSGVRSILINGNAPWSEGWKGTVEDAQMIDAQLADLDIAIDILKKIPGTDPERLGFVGHDYGAMFGALLYARPSPIKAFALIAGAPEFADWIVYFNATAAQDKPAYTKLLGNRNPLAALAKSTGIPVLLQFYEFDTFINKTRADELIAVAKDATAQFIPGTSHNGIALKGKDSRLAWLLPLLGIQNPTGK